MKTLSLSLLLCVPLLIHSQGDDYCICQELERQYEEMAIFVNSVETEAININVSPQESSQLQELIVESNPPVGELFGEKVNISPVAETPVVEEEEEIEAASPESTTDIRRKPLKKRFKKIKAKVKRKKRFKKYRGGCPAF